MPVTPVPTPSPQPSPQAAMPPGGGPPTGPSPATGPTQNRGYEVAAQKMTGLALLILERALPLAGAGSPLGNEIHKSIGGLAKHVPPGTVTPADIQNQMEQLMLKQRQFGAQVAQMKSQAAQPQQQPPQPVAPGGAPMAKAA